MSSWKVVDSFCVVFGLSSIFNSHHSHFYKDKVPTFFLDAGNCSFVRHQGYMCSKQGSTSRRSRREFGSDGTEWGWWGLDVHCLGVVAVWPIPDNLSIPAAFSLCIYNELKV